MSHTTAAGIRGSRHKAPQHGYTLVEITVVLLVIGLIIGAAAVGRDLQRTASYNRMSNDFVQGWQLAYDAYLAGVGRPPGDNAASPTGQINGGAAPARQELCGTTLINTFLAAGIRLPEGRSAGQPDRYAYLDSNGNPQEVQVCLQNVDWAEAGASVGVFVTRPRNVMILKSVTPALANLLDAQVDGVQDARFGRVRQDTQANATATTTSQLWGVDERMAYGSTVATSNDEAQVAVMTAYMQMLR
jgi:prepilin-type N-terminal cleavage/methylation domain-containing protein